MSIEIRPEKENLKAFFAVEDDGPVVMVNLLKFKPGGGSKAYGKYASAFGKMLAEAGGRFLFQGRVEATIVGDQDYHAVALVEYPSREVFRRITTSEAYEAIHVYRDEGLERTLLYATTQRA